MKAQVRVTKEAAAQRQIDAAIRMLFSGEDILAVHSIVAAAHGIVSDLGKKRGVDWYADSAREALESMYLERTGKTIPGDFLQEWVPRLSKHLHGHLRHPVNFLKHADREKERALDPGDLETDRLLMITCVMYEELGLEPTLEMEAFGKWRLATWPLEDGDKIQTGAGYVHEMPRAHQIEFGEFLLGSYREPDEPE